MPDDWVGIADVIGIYKAEASTVGDCDVFQDSLAAIVAEGKEYIKMQLSVRKGLLHRFGFYDSSYLRISFGRIVWERSLVALSPLPI